MYTFEDSVKYLIANDAEIVIEDDRFINFNVDCMGITFYIDLDFSDVVNSTCYDLDALIVYHALNLIIDLEDNNSKETCDKLFEKFEIVAPGYVKRTYTEEYTLEDLEND